MNVSLNVNEHEAYELLVLVRQKMRGTRLDATHPLLPRSYKDIARKWQQRYKDLATKIEEQLPD